MNATGIIVDLSLLMIFTLITYSIIRGVLLIKSKQFFFKKELIYSALVVYTVALVGVTLLPIRIPLGGKVYRMEPFINLIPLNFTQIDVNVSKFILFKNVFGNLILLAPLGMFLPLIWNERFRDLKKVLPFGFLVSLIIEIIQYIETYEGVSMSGRISDINDIIFNTISIFIGYVLFKKIQEKFKCLSFT